MLLSAGTRLGPYEIVSQLGAGGMGEVYRARDSNLGRSVAIKVLPSQVANDHEMLDRFRREARVLASLNHPNIASIYGFEDSDKRGLVMELVEGQTLADRLRAAPMPVDEALPIAKSRWHDGAGERRQSCSVSQWRGNGRPTWLAAGRAGSGHL
jgi:eukaryotic-like serine/threonine-protein kinase